MTMSPVRVVSVVTTMLVGAGLVLPAAASTAHVGATRTSVSAMGEQGNDRSETPALSADGSVVAFTSIASNLVPDDTNRSGPFAFLHGGKDVFVRDLSSGSIERVSVYSDGRQSGTNSVSDAPAVSHDGRFVTFHSSAGLDSSDFNGRDDVYIHDRQTAETERVTYSADGLGTNEDSRNPSISADGRYVAFYSYASNLVENDNNGTLDIFVRDRETDTTERVSVASDGTEADGFSLFPSLSADGRYVTFVSQASNLVPNEVLGLFDVYIHDRETHETEHVSVTSNETIGNEISYFSSVSGDGRYVAFDSTANNLVPEDTNTASDVFIRDRDAGLTTRVSVSSFGEELNGHSFHPSISSDGRFVSFTSEADNVVEGATTDVRKVYLHDRLSGTTSLLSHALDGQEPNGPTETDTALHTMSDDGIRFAMSSEASNLVADDTNEVRDVFTVEGETHFGISDLHVSTDDHQVMVSGVPRATGILLTQATDEVDDGLPGSTVVGGEITGARLVHRPILGDVLATMLLEPPPKSPVYVRMFPNTQNIRPPLPGGTPGVVHTLSIAIEDRRYEVRALPAAASGNPPSAPFFGLFRCDPVCLQIATLRGGHTTTGTEVVVSIPLDLVGAAEGSTFSDVRVSTGLGDAASGGVVDLDDVSLPGATVADWEVSLGIAPAGTPPDEVNFSTDAALNETGFSGSLDVSSLSSGDYDVWARACLGDVCGSASAPVTLGAVVELKDTNLELSVESRGRDMTLRARLTDLDSPQDGISDKTIDFYSDSELIGSDVTDLDGVATIALPPGHRGANRTYEAVFAGDDLYGGSSDIRPGRGGGQGGETSRASQAGRSSHGAVFFL